MPKPNRSATYGERKRLTEKEKYRALAEAQYFVEHANKLRSIPDQLDEANKISPETRAKLDEMAKDLEALNAVWKEYSSAYLNVSRVEMRENEKEKDNMVKLLSGLDKITKQMKALQGEKNPVADREEFAEAYAAVTDIAGHYHEMTNGTLEVPEMTDEQKKQMITVKKEINIVSDSNAEYMISLAKKPNVVSAEYAYVDLFDQPLFTHEPTPDDIMQGHLGDCYFISALSSIAANNPQIIRDMMKDNGDGTVTVRLFDEKEDGKIEPMYINVEKSIPMIKLELADGKKAGADLNATGCLWVQMLEKAYAAANIHEKENKFSETERSYTDIASGNGSGAFRVLLGRQNIKSDFISIRLEYPDSENKAAMEELYERLKKSVLDHHIITTSTSTDYLSADLKNKFFQELKIAKDLNAKSEHPIPDRKVRDNVAQKVFYGVLATFDKGSDVPKFGDHAYTLIDVYEKKGQKYVLVRNPHARTGFMEGKESSDADKGYCEIPFDKYVKMFKSIHKAKPLEAKFYQDFSAEYREPLSKLYHGFLDTRSWKAKASLGLSLSGESSDLKNALKKVHKLQKQKFPSKYAVKNAYQELENAASAYLKKHVNDNVSEMKDSTNRRITVAKACMAMCATFLSPLEEEKDVKTEIQRIGRMMITERGVFVTEKASEREKVNPDARGIFTDVRVNRALKPVAGDRLFDIALKTPAHEIPSQMMDEIAKALKEKQGKDPVQKEAVKEAGKQAENKVALE